MQEICKLGVCSVFSILQHQSNCARGAAVLSELFLGGLFFSYSFSLKANETPALVMMIIALKAPPLSQLLCNQGTKGIQISFNEEY